MTGTQPDQPDFSDLLGEINASLEAQRKGDEKLGSEALQARLAEGRQIDYGAVAEDLADLHLAPKLGLMRRIANVGKRGAIAVRDYVNASNERLWFTGTSVAVAGLGTFAIATYNPERLVGHIKDIHNCSLTYSEAAGVSDDNKMVIADRTNGLTWVYLDKDAKPINTSDTNLLESIAQSKLEMISLIDNKGVRHDYTPMQNPQMFAANNRTYRAGLRAVVSRLSESANAYRDGQSRENSYFQEQADNLADRFDPQPAKTPKSIGPPEE
jgi:hypothetical protein